MNKRWIYDLEIYPNLFLLCGKVPGTNIRIKFQVSPLGDDRDAMLGWLQVVEEMVGFNNIFYDYPMLHYALEKLWDLHPKDFCKKLFEYSDGIIHGTRRKPFNIIPVRKQIDLFLINHFDNQAKTASLKLLEFNLKMYNIQELPYTPGTILTNNEILEVIKYCDNDVDATELVYNETLAEIELREKLSPQYQIDFTNYNSTKIGEWILISKIIKELGESAVYDYYETDRGLKKFIKNTPRETIDLNDVVFNYVQFTTPPFKKLLKWFKSKIITETKGVFTEIPFEELEVIEGHYRISPKKGKQENLNIIYRDFEYVFGVGGIHGCIKAGIYEEDENYEIWDWDVASYYPNLAIKNMFYPEHFGPQFCDIYESIYIERMKYPKSKFPAENLALKLALNGSYGKSNSKYSALYDPMYTMKTTVNGQLLLCMLSERLMEEIPDCTMIQINTDGLTVRVHKDYIEQMKSICKRWEVLTKLELESVRYSRMIIRDVNNYMAIKQKDGSVKRKGQAFIHKQEPGELELHKNFSMLVVPKAIEAYFTEGILPEDFIPNHKDYFDFFKRTKVNKKDKLFSVKFNELNNIVSQREEQRIVRYFISGYQSYDKETKTYSYHGTGDVLIKEMPPLKDKTENRRMAVEAGYTCLTCNEINPNSEAYLRQNIFYPYYIDAAYKVINSIMYPDE